MTDVRLAISGGVATITLDRPEVLNAVRRRTIDELFTALDRVETDPAVRAVVITGSGRAFSSGQDLRELADELDTMAGDGRAEIERLQDITRRWLALDIPTIAAVNGVAVGLGAELALCCDLRLAAPETTIGFVEVTRGLFETNGVMYLLPRLVGLGIAAELLLTGARITADRAHRIGLVNHVVDSATLVDEAQDLAARIARNSPLSMRLIKQVLRRTFDESIDEVMRRETDGMLACLASDNLREGLTAFAERREPEFQR